MDYFIKFDYQPEQGINSEGLIKRIKENRISSNTMVRKVDSTEWKPLGSYPEFLNLTPPPLPDHKIIVKTALENVTVNQSKSQIPRYFMPVGRIGRFIWLMRNTINFFACLILINCLSILPEELHFLIIIPILLYIYIVIITSAKRFHDLNVTGWMAPIVFIPLVPLFLLILSGTKTGNRFGEETENLFS
jgi:uncharacterized membrane protein YhaH (DUF805 family)